MVKVSASSLGAGSRESTGMSNQHSCFNPFPLLPMKVSRDLPDGTMNTGIPLILSGISIDP